MLSKIDFILLKKKCPNEINLLQLKIIIQNTPVPSGQKYPALQGLNRESTSPGITWSLIQNFPGGQGWQAVSDA